jgi:flavorubredoxin
VSIPTALSSRVGRYLLPSDSETAASKRRNVEPGGTMNTKTTEIADGIYRFSTYLEPANLRFNQYLIAGDEPLIFHCGYQKLFPLVSAAVARVAPLDSLRWITFGHYEADECGSMNEWLRVAPKASIAFGEIGCMVSVGDMALRAPRALKDGETIDLGGKRVKYFYTPHVPHGWDAGLLFEETTRTLLCGDLFTQVGDGPDVTESDIVAPALSAEDMYLASSLTAAMAPTIRKLAKLEPTALALMHGPAFRGNAARALNDLADGYAQRFEKSLGR